MVTPLALYRTQIRHVRTHPVRHEFSYRSYWWLVDTDQLSRLPWALRRLAHFDSRDYCGDPTLSIGDNVRATLAEHNIDLHGGTIRMLSTPRALGHSFNPITVFWCHRDSGEIAAVIAEVHNTYGDRHRYVLRTDEHGRATAEKALYVSPFYDVTGRYSIVAPEPRRSLRLQISLHRADEAPFVASVQGIRVPCTRRIVAAALTTAPTLATSLRIRRQGIALWRRRLPIHPRHHDGGVT